MRLHARLQQAMDNKGQQRISGRISQVVGAGVYVVISDGGARIRVESDRVYTTGQRVTLLQGRILGTTGRGNVKQVQG